MGSARHPLHQPPHLALHLVGRQMHFLAVTGQDPLEAIPGQPRHRLRLPRPRMPAIFLRGREMTCVAVPIEVVARKQEPVLQEQDAMPARMPRREDRSKTRRQFPWSLTLQDLFCTRL